MKHRVLSLACMMACMAAPAHGAISATKNGVTWTFNKDYVAGQYANGDPWVVGPIVITGITPTPIDGRNGTMINPPLGTTQGFDKDFISGYADYVSSLNVGKTMPLSVPVGSSVVSSITADAYTQYNTIQMFSVLTVVSSAPATGSFRPPAVGTGNRTSQWKESQIDYTRLSSLPRAALSATPNIANYVTWMSYPWLEMNSNWTGRYAHPSYMAPTGYGKDIAIRTGDAALLLNLDFTNAQKRDLLVGMIQIAIDNYGFIQNGGSWYNDGGHNIGRLTSLIIAAGVLNDTTLKNAILGKDLNFQEFQSTFFVTLEDVNRTGKIGTNGQTSYPYLVSDIGMPEWGIRHTGAPQYDNNFWGATYRDINGGTHTATTMAAKLMGLRTVINWEPLFQYAERHLNYEQSSSYAGEFNSNPTPAFHKQFYNNYKNTSPPVTYVIGDRVKLSAQTNIRASAALTATLLGTQPVDALGTIAGGPVGPDANNIIWWQMNWDTGVDGWCGQDNFIKQSGAPTPPTGLKVQ